MIVEDLAEYVDLIRALNEADAVVQAKTGTVQQLQDDISQLEREITNHRQPAEELNEDIHKYLGHSDLSLQIKETGYAVTRRGVPAESLSEGETTAIALLYFLKALRDRRFNHEEGIVVLDDPVSSLDANALFLAFGFIKERTKDVGQLFILTHNFSLFRQVRNWFGYIARQKRQRFVEALHALLHASYKSDRRKANQHDSVIGSVTSRLRFGIPVSVCTRLPGIEPYRVSRS